MNQMYFFIKEALQSLMMSDLFYFYRFICTLQMTSAGIMCILYLVPELHTLVSKVWEVLAGNKSTGTLLNLQLAFFINHLTLTQHQCWTPTALQTLKDVIFTSLCADGLKHIQDKE